MQRVLILMLIAAAAWAASSDRPGDVRVQRVPDGGIQPRVAVAADGTIHLIYFSGDPAAGDIFYVRNSGKPIRVNSHPGSAIALGNIRGPQLALGRSGRVHVAWNG